MNVESIETPDILEKASDVLHRGGLIVFPTDTAYALGADATNAGAIEKVYSVKRRGFDKPIHVVVSNIKMASIYAKVNDQSEKLAEAFFPGPLTLILQDKKKVSQRLLAGGSTLGIRIPDNVFALELVHKFNAPITATSANISGNGAPYSINEVRVALGDKFDEIDLVIDGGQLNHTIVSTLVDLTQDEPVILRPGPISREEILKVLS